MNIKSLLSTVALGIALSTSNFAIASGAHDHKPLHGGIVTEGKEMDYELVAKAGVVQLYLRDHGKPINPSKAKAKLTLLTGSEKVEVELAAVGEKLEAKGTFNLAAGTKAVALVTIDGKTYTARFALK